MFTATRTATRLTCLLARCAIIPSTHCVVNATSVLPFVPAMSSQPRRYHSRRPRAPKGVVTVPVTRSIASISFTPKPPPTPEEIEKNKHLTRKRFQDAPISALSKAGITHEYMTDVQAATFEAARSGKDLLVQAKTGTGKTLAFLLPAIERLENNGKLLDGIKILVVAPTRELVLQIKEEAQVLLKHHPFEVQSVIGGTNMETEKRRLDKARCDILIATPGRLLDHLQNTALSQDFKKLQTLVYDEADRLLSEGFRKDLENIVRLLPDATKERQSLLFSATVSDEIKEVAAKVLRTDYSFVSTLREDEQNTHQHVEQTYVITPQSNFLSTALSIIQQDMKDNLPILTAPLMNTASKIMIFFPTAKQVAFAAEALSQIPGLMPLFEIHSRKSQSHRMKTADAFKDAKNGILLSSDVTARGMDFPGVTLVLQLGLPANEEQYIHRLGRTARAGAAGRGILVLSDSEQFFLKKGAIPGLPLKPHPQLDTSVLNNLQSSIVTHVKNVSAETKASAYRAWMGYYGGYLKSMRWSKEMLVLEAHRFAVDALGWTEDKPPSLDPRTVGRMNLKGVSGLNIESRPPKQETRKRPLLA